MHWPSNRNLSEFLAVPELVRFTLADGAEGMEATLPIKSSTLTLKYLVRLRRFRLMLLRIGPDWLAYGVEVADDPDHPAVLWSLLEFKDELEGLRALTKNPKCVVFLFNEAVTNVAWANLDIDLSFMASRQLLDGVAPHPAGEETAVEEVRRRIGAIRQGQQTPDAMFVELPEVSTWHPISSTYITNRITRSLLSIFEIDEGGQQEEIALWLTDNLHPKGAVKSPQIYEPRKPPRELSDLLLTYDHGAFLIESKTLSLFNRETLPNRAKLTSGLLKHLAKAKSQLVGGVNNLRQGYKVTDKQETISRWSGPRLRT